jgi:hypothetical protein
VHSFIHRRILYSHTAHTYFVGFDEFQDTKSSATCRMFIIPVRFFTLPISPESHVAVAVHCKQFIWVNRVHSTYI